MIGQHRTRLKSQKLRERRKVKEKVIDATLDALVEDFSLEELNDLEAMKIHMKKIYGLKDGELEPILAGAIRIKLLRQDQPVFWQTLIKQRFTSH